MATNKGAKDKLVPPSPRLTPRPTAASAARAARLATNRNLANQPKQLVRPLAYSPSKSRSSPAAKSPHRSDTKALQPPLLSPEHDEFVLDEDLRSSHGPPESEVDYVIQDNTTVVIEAAVNDSQLFADIKGPEDEIERREVSEEPAPGSLPAPDNIEANSQRRTTPVSSRPQTPKLPNRPDTPKVASRPDTPKVASRPDTPKVACRPDTPKVASRPDTPEVAGRPQMPGAPPSRPTTPTQSTPVINTPLSSRPNTPQVVSNMAPVKKPKPSSCIPVMTRMQSPDTEDDLMGVYESKRKHFIRLKKDLDLKQQAVLELYSSIQGLHSRLSPDGAGAVPLYPQELEVFNVRGWAAEEVSQLCQRTSVDGARETICAITPFDEKALAELDADVISLPDKFSGLCLQAFRARQDLLDWIKQILLQNEEGGGEAVDRIDQYNKQGLHLCESLRDMKSFADNAVRTVITLSRRAIKERSALVSVGEGLVRQVSRLSADVEQQARSLHQLQSMLAPAPDHEDLRAELEEERSAKKALKEKLATAEAQLKQTRGRLLKMDKQIRESEVSIAGLTGTVKSLEDQNRQREAQLESKARKLRESMKTGEVASSQLAQQKKALQAEVQELKDSIATLTNQHKSAIQELNSQMKEFQGTLEQQEQLTQAEIELKQGAETQLQEARRQIDELNGMITEMENSRINPELPTDREMELWAELQATKDTLRMTEDEVVACKQEKVQFLETITKIADTEHKAGMQKKLATELINKEEYISKMQCTLRDLTKANNFNEQKVIQYENYVRVYLSHNRSMNNSGGEDEPTYEDLQQEVLTLRLALMESVQRSKELTEELAQKLQQLEEQDKNSRGQAKIIKVREELINMLKKKETDQARQLMALQEDLEHRMKIVDEVNQQIAEKAGEIQELFATLESKQQQIHRLEKIVLALEEQQRRAQAQRTRHEEKIAALEHELAGGVRRERKFLFF